jgi:hypothetical protein
VKLSGNVFISQLQKRPAIGAEQDPSPVLVTDNAQLHAVTDGASRCRLRRFGVVGITRALKVAPSGLVCGQLERCFALGAHVIETALGFTGINDIGAAAKRAVDNISQLESRHDHIVALGSSQHSAISRNHSPPRPRRAQTQQKTKQQQHRQSLLSRAAKGLLLRRAHSRADSWFRW